MTKLITLESLQHSIDDIARAIKDLAQFTCNGFAELNSRADGHDGRMDKLDSRMDKLDGRIDRLEKHAESVDITLRDHTMRFAQIQITLDDISGEQTA